MKPLVIYHAGCRDGFCAAWVARKALSANEPEFFAGYYGQEPPDCVGRDVVLVDFSYPLESMRAVISAANSVLVLDHHKTAQAALETLSLNPPSNTRVVFDMARSGAGLAWDEWFPGIPRHYLVAYVEDRDLWKHNLLYSKSVNAFISTLPFTFEAWDEAPDLAIAVKSGRVVEAKVAQYVLEVSKNAMLTMFEGYQVPVVCAPQTDISELLHALCQNEVFALGWWQRADGLFQYSLRSQGDFDVSVLAKRYGGGGHKNAAGFQSKVLLHAKV